MCSLASLRHLRWKRENGVPCVQLHFNYCLWRKTDDMTTKHHCGENIDFWWISTVTKNANTENNSVVTQRLRSRDVESESQSLDSSPGSEMVSCQKRRLCMGHTCFKNNNLIVLVLFFKSWEFVCLHRSLNTLSQSHKFRSRCPTLTQSQSPNFFKPWNQSRSHTKDEDSASLLRRMIQQLRRLTQSTQDVAFSIFKSLPLLQSDCGCNSVLQSI